MVAQNVEGGVDSTPPPGRFRVKKKRKRLIHIYNFNFMPLFVSRQPMEGMLSKYTNVMKGWQYRWFIMDPNKGVIEYYMVSRGKNYPGAPGVFAPEMQKKKPSKINKEPLKIAIDCSVKPVQCCRFSQWDVKSSPRNFFFFFLTWWWVNPYPDTVPQCKLWKAISRLQSNLS